MEGVNNCDKLSLEFRRGALMTLRLFAEAANGLSRKPLAVPVSLKPKPSLLPLFAPLRCDLRDLPNSRLTLSSGSFQVSKGCAKREGDEVWWPQGEEVEFRPS